MKFPISRPWFAVCALSVAALSMPLLAQTQTQSSSQTPKATAAAAPPQTADYIVALVNSEPITDGDLRAAVRRVTEQMTQQGQPLPDPQALRQGVLDRLITDRAQLQLAREYGIRADDASVDLAEQGLARQYQTTIEGLHQRFAASGQSADALRSELRDQLTLSRLREREVDARVQVSDADVDRSIAQQAQSGSDPMTQEINLAQLLIGVPERATAADVARLQAQAQQLLQRLRNGEKFATLVQQYSSADRSNGGQLGLRRADRYPPSFVVATRDLPIGGVSELVRSDAGFHILTVVERRAPSTLLMTVVQRHARHILLRPGPQLTQAAAVAQLRDFRERILKNTDTFARLARVYSQDATADRGGDLGWVNPGMFVPEFEEVLTALKPDEISQPVVSRFGVHLIQLLESRTAELSPREVREQVRQQLRQTRLNAAYVDWAKDIRERAFVELREAP